MKSVALIATLLFSIPALAAVQVEFTLDKPQAATGERVGFRIRATNSGTTAVGAYVWVINPEHNSIDLRITTQPAGWTCTGLSCSTPSFAAGVTIDFEGYVIAPTRPQPHFRLVAGIQSAGRGMEQEVRLPVVAASRSADLAVSTTVPASVRVAEGTRVLHVFEVRNNGPDAAQNLTATFGLGWYPPADVKFSGAGWTCVRNVCTRPALAAGETAPITADMTMPQSETYFTFGLNVYAQENHDPNGAGAGTAYYVGSPESWRMMLVPVPLLPANGANGARWLTDLTMFIRSDEDVEVEPDGCEPFDPECLAKGERPLRQPYDPRLIGLASFTTGQFIYVRAIDFDKVRANARVYDASRQTETAGAEIPLPRDDAFTSGTIALLNVPVAPQFRHTLRIFDDAGRDAVNVVVRLYAGAETQPRLTLPVTLLQPPEPRWLVTTARLPMQPASAQLQLGQLMSLSGIESLRVEVEPVDRGVRIWSFISITNNDTHHVTTVSPQ